MRTTILWGAVFTAILFLGACTTIDMFSYEDENIYAELETNDPARVVLTVDNRGAGEVALDWERASYAGGGRNLSLRVIEEEIPAGFPARILPGARQTRSFAPAEALTLSGGELIIADWVPEDNSEDRFSFIYSIDGRDYPLIFPDSRERPVLGAVSVSMTTALPFLRSIGERRRMIYNLALDQAKNAFGGGGKKLRLVNLRYGSSSKGFSEKAELSADVIAGEPGDGPGA
ncbi:MAG: hypothetical protein LBH51_05655 [Treponema sp.]|jgi:hypothetical protein|nr:hypothetical protein [Treponema sp.]